MIGFENVRIDPIYSRDRSWARHVYGAPAFPGLLEDLTATPPTYHILAPGLVTPNVPKGTLATATSITGPPLMPVQQAAITQPVR